MLRLDAKDEPVAIFKTNLDGGYVDLLAFQGQPLLDNTPLYITPPQRTWVGLTDEEMLTLEETTTCAKDESWLRNLTRAIEAKLKEKNT
jgi:hypothetical protein